MTSPALTPYGSWKSPITSELITASTIGLGQIAVDGTDIYWTELRPADKGRNSLVRCSADGELQDLVTPPFNVRSRVHEYGGGAFGVQQGVIFFVNDPEQRLYRVMPGHEPHSLTPDSGGQDRYADGVVDGKRDRLVCIREEHIPDTHQVINTIVSVPLQSGPDFPEGASIQVLVAGNDFYASPCLSPDGSQLAWITWNHPNMPWDGSELWVATLAADGSLGESRWIAGGLEESIFQPQWSPGGTLYFVSDRSGWWNLYRYLDGAIEPLCPMEAEFGLPQWVFGMSTYGFSSATDLICTYAQQGIWHLAHLHPETKALTAIPTPFTDLSGLRVGQGFVVFQGSSPTQTSAIARLDLETHEITLLRQSSQFELDTAYVAVPETLEFPTGQGRTTYGFFYPPCNPDFVAPTTEKPPLIVKSHGGPTAATSSSLNLKIQYWTSRGFAVLDVNYGGSTGYGRAYRQRLEGQWGIVDVDDCVNGAEDLATQGKVDGDRRAIMGSSAGGYTTLCALTFRDVFKAGASYYGVSDLEALARDTHKFEARYFDRLIGPYPEQKDLYQARSPIHFVDQLSCPVIFFQGLEDKVVPPNQAEVMVTALRVKGIPVAYVTFPEEQHGFRQAENVRRALDNELYFYAQIFGFSAADPLEPVKIDNL